MYICLLNKSIALCYLFKYILGFKFPLRSVPNAVYAIYLKYVTKATVYRKFASSIKFIPEAAITVQIKATTSIHLNIHDNRLLKWPPNFALFCNIQARQTFK